MKFANQEMRRLLGMHTSHTYICSLHKALYCSGLFLVARLTSCWLFMVWFNSINQLCVLFNAVRLINTKCITFINPDRQLLCDDAVMQCWCVTESFRSHTRAAERPFHRSIYRITAASCHVKSSAITNTLLSRHKIYFACIKLFFLLLLLLFSHEPKHRTTEH